MINRFRALIQEELLNSLSNRLSEINTVAQYKDLILQEMLLKVKKKIVRMDLLLVILLVLFLPRKRLFAASEKNNNYS